jgi:hypothetical protein
MTWDACVPGARVGVCHQGTWQVRFVFLARRAGTNSGAVKRAAAACANCPSILAERT